MFSLKTLPIPCLYSLEKKFKKEIIKIKKTKSKKIIKFKIQKNVDSVLICLNIHSLNDNKHLCFTKSLMMYTVLCMLIQADIIRNEMVKPRTSPPTMPARASSQPLFRILTHRLKLYL